MGRYRIATDKCAKASTKQLHGFPGLDTASGAHLWCHRKICFFFFRPKMEGTWHWMTGWWLGAPCEWSVFVHQHPPHLWASSSLIDAMMLWSPHFDVGSLSSCIFWPLSSSCYSVRLAECFCRAFDIKVVWLKNMTLRTQEASSQPGTEMWDPQPKNFQCLKGWCWTSLCPHTITIIM